MKIQPVFTEKSTANSKKGKYTFWVEAGVAKGKIKSEVGKVFNVDVVGVRTLRVAGRKKAVIELKEGQKIDIFEEKKKKK